jgi:hypothetical protein
MAFHVASVLPLVCSLYLAQDGAKPETRRADPGFSVADPQRPPATMDAEVGEIP